MVGTGLLHIEEIPRFCVRIVRPERHPDQQRVQRGGASVQQAVEVVPKRVAHYAARMGVTYGRITIRHQRTRWGSCSSNGNLNFNCLLMLAPPEVLDYVVVHELCHRKYMNHSKQFWAEVAKVMPDYKKCERWLKEEGSLLIG